MLDGAGKVKRFQGLRAMRKHNNIVTSAVLFLALFGLDFASINSIIDRNGFDAACLQKNSKTEGRGTVLTNLDRFTHVMEYQPVDRVPNWEVGVWPQTVERWEREGLDRRLLHWDWFTGEDYFGLDPREYIPVNLSMAAALPHRGARTHRPVRDRPQRQRHRNQGADWRARSTADGCVWTSICPFRWKRWPILRR